MYLHLGEKTVVPAGEIIGIFDMDTSTVGKNTRNFLARAEKAGQVINVSYELPKSFVLRVPPGGKSGGLLPARKKRMRTGDKAPPVNVYISQISSATLLKRSLMMDGMNNVK